MSLLSAKLFCTQLSAEYFSKPSEGREGKKLASTQPTPKEYNHFWGWPPTTAIYPKSCYRQVFAPAGRSSKPSEVKKNKTNSDGCRLSIE